jgi:hypothetical protein
MWPCPGLAFPWEEESRERYSGQESGDDPGFQ